MSAADQSAIRQRIGRWTERSGSWTSERGISGRLAQRVADPADGLDQARLAVGLELLAQPHDDDVDDVRLAHEVGAPDPLEDRLAREDLAGVAGHELEQVVLASGQLDRAFAAPDLARRRVDRQVGVAVDLAFVSTGE